MLRNWRAVLAAEMRHWAEQRRAARERWREEQEAAARAFEVDFGAQVIDGGIAKRNQTLAS